MANIKGSSRILSKDEKSTIASRKSRKSRTDKVQTAEIIKPKTESAKPTGITETTNKANDRTEAARNLIANAEVQKVVKGASALTKTVMSKAATINSKRKKLTSKALKKTRGLHPKMNNLITNIDYAVDYLTKPQQLENRSEVVQYTRSAAIFGIWVIIITFLGFGTWSMIAPLDSAAVSIGNIVLESKKRIVQHLEGGNIEKVLVRNGDLVEEGQILVELSKTGAQSKFDQLSVRLTTTIAEENRLESERDGRSSIRFDDEILVHAGEKEVAKSIQAQERLFEARKASLIGQLDIRKQEIKQLQEVKSATLEQEKSNKKQIAIINEQIVTVNNLLEKGNATKVRQQELESTLARVQGERSSIIGKLAETNERIYQGQLTLDAIRNEFLEKVVTALRENRQQQAELREALKEVADILARTSIRAPISGVVNNLQPQVTPGAVVSHNGFLLEVIPQDDKLVIDAQVKPTDIDVVRVGQDARVRLTPFKSRVVPMLTGKVVSVSPDLVMPTQQGQLPHYLARIEIDADSLKAVEDLRDVKLYPGMPTEVLIVIGTRTVMKYLLDPITQTFNISFREQ